jgi:hypothetical protein
MYIAVESKLTMQLKIKEKNMTTPILGTAKP